MSTNDDASKREAAYQAWKDRLSQRKADDQEAFAPIADEVPVDPSAGYWSAESLFRDSALESEKETRQRVEEAERSRRASELLAVLQLPGSATIEQVSARYRQLAKDLHPDRHPQGTPEASRAALQLVEYSAAYGELKGLL